MTQPQTIQNNDLSSKQSNAKTLADLSRGLFFLTASLSLIIIMSMFVFVWQPIWTEGFKDFHTISESINDLNKTAQPASATVPLMLEQMAGMNESMLDIKLFMQNIHNSMLSLEEVNPNIKKMTESVENMSLVISSQMGQMNQSMDQIENRFSPSGMLPFNW